MIMSFLVKEGRTTGEDPEATGHRIGTAMVKGKINPRKSDADVLAQVKRIGSLVSKKHTPKPPAGKGFQQAIVRGHQRAHGLNMQADYLKGMNRVMATGVRVRQRQRLGYEPPEDETHKRSFGEGTTTGEDPKATGNRVGRALVRGSTGKNLLQVNVKRKSVKDVQDQVDRIKRKMFLKHGMKAYNAASDRGQQLSPEGGAEAGTKAKEDFDTAATSITLSALNARKRNFLSKLKKPKEGENEG